VGPGADPAPLELGEAISGFAQFVELMCAVGAPLDGEVLDALIGRLAELLGEDPSLVA
jgi:hypothetical protein